MAWDPVHAGAAADAANKASVSADGAGDKAADAGNKAADAGKSADKAAGAAGHAAHSADHAAHSVDGATTQLKELNETLKPLHDLEALMKTPTELFKEPLEMLKGMTDGGKGLEATGPLAAIDKTFKEVSEPAKSGELAEMAKGGFKIPTDMGVPEAGSSKENPFADMLKGFKASSPDIMPEIPLGKNGPIDMEALFAKAQETLSAHKQDAVATEKSGAPLGGQNQTQAIEGVGGRQ